jgi:signal peptidase I, bacterial type
VKRFRVLYATLLVIALLRVFVLSPLLVEGTSMQNTLQSGDLAFVLRAGAEKRGDIVHCTFDGRDGTYVKRIIGLPGETVAAKGGVVTVDGVPLDEAYVTSPTDDFVCTVPQDAYFVMGDNRTDSYDSRMEDMGCVRRKNILGTLWCVLYPHPRLLK